MRVCDWSIGEKTGRDGYKKEIEVGPIRVN